MKTQQSRAFRVGSASRSREPLAKLPDAIALVVSVSFRLCRKSLFPRRKRSELIRNHPHSTRNKHRAPPPKHAEAMEASQAANPISIRVHPYQSAAISPVTSCFLSARQHQWQVACRTLDENSKVMSVSGGFCNSREPLAKRPYAIALVVSVSFRLCRKSLFPRRKRSALIRNHPHSTRNKHRAPPPQAC